MALEIYRSGTEKSAGFDRYSEICRSCAEKEVKKNFYVEYDLYLSERTNAVSRDDSCQICNCSFFIDGRKKNEKLKGVIY